MEHAVAAMRYGACAPVLRACASATADCPPKDQVPTGQAALSLYACPWSVAQPSAGLHMPVQLSCLILDCDGMGSGSAANPDRSDANRLNDTNRRPFV